MPLYDYDCAECGRRVEVAHGVYAPGPTHCPNCGGGPLRKAISAPAVHFKGAGWAKKERHAAVASGSRKDSDTSNAGDADIKGKEGEGKGAPGKDGPDKDGPDKDGPGKGGAASPADRSAQKAGDRSGRDERPAASSKPAATSTATKTD